VGGGGEGLKGLGVETCSGKMTRTSQVWRFLRIQWRRSTQAIDLLDTAYRVRHTRYGISSASFQAEIYACMCLDKGAHKRQKRARPDVSLYVCSAENVSSRSSALLGYDQRHKNPQPA
jgi:hypothetical protein